MASVQGRSCALSTEAAREPAPRPPPLSACPDSPDIADRIVGILSEPCHMQKHKAC